MRHSTWFRAICLLLVTGASLAPPRSALGNPIDHATTVTIAPTVVRENFKLTASDAAAEDEFGECVAVSGDNAVVGASRVSHAGGDGAGAAYYFARSGTSWSEQSKLTASDAEDRDNLGGSVAVSGDTAVVGAHLDDHSGEDRAGSTYVFELDEPPGEDLIIDFGPGGGLGMWIYYNDSTWNWLLSRSPESFVTGDLDGNGKDDLAVDFGVKFGIWVDYNDGSWDRLHQLSSEKMVTGELGGLPEAGAEVDVTKVNRQGPGLF